MNNTMNATICSCINNVLNQIAETNPEFSKGNVSLAGETKWGEIIGQIQDQADLIALLEEIKASLGAAYHFKGSIESQSNLPEDAEVGDVYNVEDTGANYAWTGAEWDKLSETIDLSSYLTKTEATESYYTKDEASALDAKIEANTEAIEAIDVSNYATKDELAAKADTSALANYATTEAIADLATKAELAAKADTTALDAYATTSALTEGLETKADKQTTLAGYGITDAYTKSEADGKFATKEQGAKADTAVQPAALDAYVKTETATATYAQKTELVNKADTSALEALQEQLTELAGRVEALEGAAG